MEFICRNNLRSWNNKQKLFLYNFIINQNVESVHRNIRIIHLKKADFLRILPFSFRACSLKCSLTTFVTSNFDVFALASMRGATATSCSSPTTSTSLSELSHQTSNDRSERARILTTLVDFFGTLCGDGTAALKDHSSWMLDDEDDVPSSGIRPLCL